VFLQVFDVALACFLLRRNQRRTAAKPTYRPAERQMKIQREVPVRLSVGPHLGHELCALDFVREVSRGRVRRVSRTRHVILLDQAKIDLKRAHVNSALWLAVFLYTPTS